MSHKKYTRIHIGKLKDIPRTDLEEFVKRFGKVTDLLIKESFAFVEYAYEDQALKAIKEMDGRWVCGNRITCNLANENLKRYIPNTSRVYIGRMGSKVTYNDLQDLFGKFGKIIDLKKKDEYGFIEYEDENAAQQAIMNMDGFEIKGQRLYVRESRINTEKMVLSSRLYLGNLGKEVKTTDILAHFEEFGNILEINLKDEFGFVQYDRFDSALKAINKMNGQIIGNSKITVQVSMSKTEEQFKAYQQILERKDRNPLRDSVSKVSMSKKISKENKENTSSHIKSDRKCFKYSSEKLPFSEFNIQMKQEQFKELQKQFSTRKKGDDDDCFEIVPLKNITNQMNVGQNQILFTPRQQPIGQQMRTQSTLKLSGQKQPLFNLINQNSGLITPCNNKINFIE